MSDSDDMKRYLQETAHPTEAQLNSSLDPKKYLEETNSSPSTFESRNLEPNVYPAMGAFAKALDVASTPVQWVNSLAIQPAVAMQEQLTGQEPEPFINPITHPLDAANKYGSTSAIFNKVPSLNQPIAPDINISEAPKLSSVLSRITGANALSLPADIALTHGISYGAGKVPVPTWSPSEGAQLRPAAKVFSDLASSDREKALIRASSLGQEDTSKIANDMTAKRVGDTLNRYGLDNKIIMPDQLKIALSGKDGNPGVIDEVGKEIGNLKNAVNSQVPPMRSNDLIDIILDKIKGNRNDPNSGVSDLSQQDINNLHSKISEIVKPEHGDKSFSDLVDLKRNSQNEVWKMTPEQRQALAMTDPSWKAIKTALWSAIDEHQNNVAEILPEARDFVDKNADYHDLKLAENIVKGGKLESMNVPSLPESLMMLEGTKDIMPMASGRNLRQNIGFWAKKFPALTGSLEEGVSNAMTNPLQNPVKISAPASAASIQQQSQRLPQNEPMQVGRIPQSVNSPTPQQQLMMRKGFVENLAEFKVPRTVDGILGNKDLVLAKLAQVTNDPKIVDTLRDSLNMHPELLKDTLPALQMQFPQIFQPNKYMSWSNGKILDPMEAQKAYKDVNSRQISNTQKIMLQDGLNRDGSFPESF